MRLLILPATLAAVTLAIVGQQPTTPNASNATTQTTKKSEAASSNCADIDQLRKNVAQLSGENQRLKKRVAYLERDRSVATIQEQLEKEEQRGETLQHHLFEISEKEGSLSTRMDQLAQQLSPEAIDRSLAGVGSLHPEDAREDIRRRLTNEKTRIQTQLDLLKQDQRRTQASLATTDAAIQRLKQKLLEAQRPQ
jgi:chromosome segregation ATPase